MSPLAGAGVAPCRCGSMARAGFGLVVASGMSYAAHPSLCAAQAQAQFSHPCRNSSRRI